VLLPLVPWRPGSRLGRHGSVDGRGGGGGEERRGRNGRGEMCALLGYFSSFSSKLPYGNFSAAGLARIELTDDGPNTIRVFLGNEVSSTWNSQKQLITKPIRCTVRSYGCLAMKLRCVSS
jgi:hypothetical protein